MDFKELLEKNKDKILKDIQERTGITFIKKLKVTTSPLDDDIFRGNLISNYIDKYLEGFELGFYKAYYDFWICYYQDTNVIEIRGRLKYATNDNYTGIYSINKTTIYDKETGENLLIKYIVENEELVLVDKFDSIKEGSIKIEMISNDIQNITRTYINEKVAKVNLLYLLEDFILKEINLEHIRITVFKQGVFKEEIPESLNEIINEVFYKRNIELMDRLIDKL